MIFEFMEDEVGGRRICQSNTQQTLQLAKK